MAAAIDLNQMVAGMLTGTDNKPLTVGDVIDTLSSEKDRLLREVEPNCNERLVCHVHDATDAIGKAIAALDKYLSKAGA